MDIQCIDVDPVTHKVIFGIKPKIVTGISKLVQIVVISLLNVPGRAVLDPAGGGGLPDLLGININPNDSTETFGEVVRRVKKSEKEIISRQIAVDDPPEELLSEIQVVNIQQGGSEDDILLSLRVLNQKGQKFDLVI